MGDIHEGTGSSHDVARNLNFFMDRRNHQEGKLQRSDRLKALLILKIFQSLDFLY